MSKLYALYKGDKFIDLGTKQYLANKLGVKVETINFYMTPTYKKRHDLNISYVVIRIEDDKDE